MLLLRNSQILCSYSFSFNILYSHYQLISFALPIAVSGFLFQPAKHALSFSLTLFFQRDKKNLKRPAKKLTAFFYLFSFSHSLLFQSSFWREWEEIENEWKKEKKKLFSSWSLSSLKLFPKRRGKGIFVKGIQMLTRKQ